MDLIPKLPNNHSFEYYLINAHNIRIFSEATEPNKLKFQTGLSRHGDTKIAYIVQLKYKDCRYIHIW